MSLAPNAAPAIFLIGSPQDHDWVDRFTASLQARGLTVLDEVPLLAPYTPDAINADLVGVSGRAQLALFLVSDAALSDSWVMQDELPHLLTRRQQEGLWIVPILVRPAAWQANEFLRNTQMLPRSLRPLSELPEADLPRAVDDIVTEVVQLLAEQGNVPAQISSAGISSGASVETGAVATVGQVSAAPADQDLVPLSRLDRFELSPLVRDINQLALLSMHSQQVPLAVSSSAILFALLLPSADQVHSSDRDSRIAAEVLGSAVFVDEYQACREAYLGRKGADPSATLPPRSMTAAALALFEQAERIALRTSGQRQIHSRHLLAALLLENPTRSRSGARDRFAELRVEPARLRIALLDRVRSNIPEDDPARWAELFAGPRRSISGYDPDSARGKTDLLGVMPDVNAFAALIAATTVVPPLSIGLFGDWGSGKSFFMHQLKQTVEDLAREARAADQPQAELHYYKRIVQIEFNAWHYAEGNLWASLVEHIFANLRIEDAGSVEALQKRILHDLRFTEAQVDRAHAEETQAQTRVKQAQAELEAVATRIETECQTLANLTAQDVLAQATDEDLPARDRAELEDLLHQSGIQAVSTSTDDLLTALDGARQGVTRGGLLLNWLADSSHPRLQFGLLVAALLVPVVLAIVVGVFVSRAVSPDLAQISAFFTGLAALAAGLVAAVSRATGWLNGWLTRAERIKQRVDARVNRRRAEGQAEIKRVEQMLQHHNAEYLAARHKADEAQNKLDEKRGELARATPGGLLASFIQDRVKSDDYRQYLGVLAVIRRDFERLSNLMDLQNWQLAPPLPGDPQVRDGVRRFATLAEERHGEDERVNRIVLYIDDLDRCPPRKVVEVLQAVHLLLAFPLFVVVVGVDARWVERALVSTYGRLLTGGGATPADYLEKVFQIPFWLDQTKASARRRMLHALLGPSVEPDLTQTPANGVNHSQEPAGTSSAKGTDASAESVTEGSPLAAVGEGAAVADSGGAPQRVVDTTASRPVAQGLTIRQSELAYMDELSEILGHSPRSLKRFVNVYRLVKASLSDDGQQVLVDTQQYRVVQFLLALVTGAPRLAQAFVAVLESTAADTPLVNLVRELDADEDVVSCAEWPGVRGWLSEARGEQLGGRTGALLEWLPRVRRYSFGLGPFHNIRVRTAT